MKVFEVITETGNKENSNLVKTIQFVTSENNSMESVVRYYTKQCENYCLNLKSVSEIIIISNHIPKEW